MRAWDRMHAGEGFLYIASVDGRPHYKIGFSLNPRGRMRQLGQTERGKCTLLAFMPGSRADEKKLHKALVDCAIFPRPDFRYSERYPRSVVDHPAFPAGLMPSGAA